METGYAFEDAFWSKRVGSMGWMQHRSTTEGAEIKVRRRLSKSGTYIAGLYVVPVVPSREDVVSARAGTQADDHHFMALWHERLEHIHHEAVK